jgi:hypothetical protein
VNARALNAVHAARVTSDADVLIVLPLSPAVFHVLAPDLRNIRWILITEPYLNSKCAQGVDNERTLKVSYHHHHTTTTTTIIVTTVHALKSAQ